MGAPQATPPPLLGALNQVGAQRVALNVTANGEEMGVLLHDEGLKAPLIQMTGTCSRAMRVPALRVREGYQAHVVGEVPIVPRPQHEMPVVRHQTPRENTHGNTILNFSERAFEIQVIRILLEYLQTCIRAIENVVHKPAWRCS